MNHKQEICIRAAIDIDFTQADNAAMAEMQQLARTYKAADNGGCRLKIHLILNNHLLASTMRRVPLDDAFSNDIELYSYSHEDLCSMHVLGIRPGSIPLLLRERIPYESNRYIHFVIFGAGRQAESLAIHAALTCHLPNYCRDNSLRTRITWFADSEEEFRQFINTHTNLLNHSYQRHVNISNGDIAISTTPPLHADTQPDFVDVEWEFVTGKSCSHIAQHKLQRWSASDGQLLTLAFCYDNNSRNLNEAISLPSIIRKNCKILVKCDEPTSIGFINHSSEYINIIPFGCHEVHTDELSDYTLMARYINFAYRNMRTTTSEERSHGADTIAVETAIPSMEQLDAAWNSSLLPTAKCWSNIYNVFSLNTKMQTLGIPAERWSTLFGINEKDIALMTQVEHNRWCIEELILGYTPTTREQHEAIMNDISLREAFKKELIHDDLRSFSQLGTDSSGESVIRYDRALTRSLPLIAHAFHTMKAESE